MHVALTVGSFSQAGGIERVAVQLAIAYQALGHEVTVIATDWDPQYEDRFRFERVAAPARPAWWRTLQLPPAVAKAVRRGRYDLVHGHGTSTLTCDLLTYHTVHAAWLAISVAEEGPGSWRRLAKQAYPFHRATIAMEQRQARTHAGHFHTCSRAVRDEAIAHYGIAPDRVKAIPWGIDLDLFQPDAGERAETRRGWGVGPDTPVLLLVANEYHRKGLATILHAMTTMKTPDVRLVVAGRADASAYQRLAVELGVAPRVTWLGHAAPAPLYRAADLFVMPTTYEGWALVIGEALASGLPVVTTPFAGSSDMISDGQNGRLLADPRDPVALARLLDEALADRAAMAARCRPGVMNASWTEVGRSILAWGSAMAPVSRPQ